jgi:adenylate cyclase
MSGNTTVDHITVDLNEFKLHIALKRRIELTLHFNSPSRRFYLSVIALVVNEMKKLGKIAPVPLEGHIHLLALLNDTIGGSAGSSEKKSLFYRIYRKWRYALPNLEEAPLFTVLGRKKGYEEGTGKSYHVTEAERDAWANLFEYQGSDENASLKFAVDKIGGSLDDVVILYEGSQNAEAWERFISSLNGKEGERQEPEPERRVPVEPVSEEPRVAIPILERKRESLRSRYLRVTLTVAIVVVLGAIIIAIWGTFLKPAPVGVASIGRMAFPLPDKPSIAVLPFINMSEDPKQEFFGDGLAEELINALVRWPPILVVARASSFIYKGKSVNVNQVGRELDVRYVLEGSVRREGDRVRITAQLIDTTTQHHLFSERYEREMRDIFAIQDEITMKVLTAMQISVYGLGVPASRLKPTENIEAYLKLMEADAVQQLGDRASQARARQLSEEAIALDPGYAPPYRMLAAAIGNEIMLGVHGKDPSEALERAITAAQKGVQLDESSEHAHRILAFVALLSRDFEKAIAEAERAVAVAPNSAMAHYMLGNCLSSVGRTEEGLPILRKAVALSPIPLPRALDHLCIATRKARRYEEAVAVCRQLLQREPNHLFAHLTLAATFVEMEKMEEARAEISEVLRIDPKYSVKVVPRAFLWKEQAEIDRLIDSLRRAGLE